MAVGTPPRDSRKDPSYWVDFIAPEQRHVDVLRTQIARGGTYEQRAQWLIGIAGSEQRLAVAMYSEGAPLAAVRAKVASAIDARIEAIAGTPDEPFDLRSRDSYFSALWMVSLGYTLAVDGSKLSGLVQAIGNHRKDAMYEALLSATGLGGHKTDRILHPRPYGLLLDAIESAPEKRPSLIRTYLDRYYEQSRGAYWWGSHHSGVPYVGYWCFEVAAFVRALSIPDDVFSDHTFYPRELARADAI